MQTNENTDYLLQHITSLLARTYDQILDEQLGVGYAQFKLLKIIHDTPNVKQKFIANMLSQTEASISRQVKLLIKSNLLKMTVDPLNKRAHLAVLTPKGRRITEAAIIAVARYNNPVFDHLSTKQKGQFIALLEMIDKQICSIDHESDFVRFLTES